jgi:hypothetical protein
MSEDKPYLPLGGMGLAIVLVARQSQVAPAAYWLIVPIR